MVTGKISMQEIISTFELGPYAIRLWREDQVFGVTLQCGNYQTVARFFDHFVTLIRISGASHQTCEGIGEAPHQ